MRSVSGGSTRCGAEGGGLRLLCKLVGCQFRAYIDVTKFQPVWVPACRLQNSINLEHNNGASWAAGRLCQPCTRPIREH